MNSTCLFPMEVWKTEDPGVNFEKRFGHYEIYTWTLCHSYLHEKQTSRIQSLNKLNFKFKVKFQLEPSTFFVSSWNLCGASKSKAWQTDRKRDGGTDRQTMDNVISMWCFASLAPQKLWYQVKGLVIKNAYLEYESSICSGMKVMAKVFVLMRTLQQDILPCSWQINSYEVKNVKRRVFKFNMLLEIETDVQAWITDHSIFNKN